MFRTSSVAQRLMLLWYNKEASLNSLIPTPYVYPSSPCLWPKFAHPCTLLVSGQQALEYSRASATAAGSGFFREKFALARRGCPCQAAAAGAVGSSRRRLSPPLRDVRASDMHNPLRQDSLACNCTQTTLLLLSRESCCYYKSRSSC